MYFGDDDSLVAEVIDNTTSRGRTLRFLYDGSYDEFRKATRAWTDSLPKYIKRSEEDFDKERYQTIYAKTEGAVAAPTAGLHFSKHVKETSNKGQSGELTLHVGLGTFNPVEVEDYQNIRWIQKNYLLMTNLLKWSTIQNLIKKVCAIGTTVMRGLESSVSSMGTLNPYQGWTHKFIFPPYNFSIADSLVTNFHMPKSTLLMMVSAFCGHDFMMEAYQVAVKEKYRFYSYGDAMLIL